MCIAIVKPMSLELPSKDVLERCFRHNSDGAGFAYSADDEKSFVIRKGLMTFEHFYSELLKVKEPTKRLMLLHFRIGTHGSSDNPKHTHPFPVSEKLESLEALHLRTHRVAMHNGILSRWGDSTGYYSGWDYQNNKWKKEGESKNGMSDTMEFIKDFVAPLSNLANKARDSIYNNEKLQDMVGHEVAGSRFVIAEPDGRYIYWGSWVKDGGLIYSNSDYKREFYVPPKTTTITTPTTTTNPPARTSWPGPQPIILDALKGTNHEIFKADVDMAACEHDLLPLTEGRWTYMYGTYRYTINQSMSNKNQWFYTDMEVKRLYRYDGIDSLSYVCNFTRRWKGDYADEPKPEDKVIETEHIIR